MNFPRKEFSCSFSFDFGTINIFMAFLFLGDIIIDNVSVIVKLYSEKMRLYYV